MKKGSVKRVVFSGFFIGIGLILPYFTGQIPEIGKMLLPMHIPVFLCGFVCGPLCGAAVGIITPLLRAVVCGMPILFPNAVIMSFELLAYGGLSGFFFKSFPKRKGYIYLSLALSMLLGRILWGAVSFGIYTFLGSSFTWESFCAGAFFTALPGIILQFIIIPPIVEVLKKNRIVRSRSRKKHGA